MFQLIVSCLGLIFRKRKCKCHVIHLPVDFNSILGIIPYFFSFSHSIILLPLIPFMFPVILTLFIFIIPFIHFRAAAMICLNNKVGSGFCPTSKAAGGMPDAMLAFQKWKTFCHSVPLLFFVNYPSPFTTVSAAVLAPRCATTASTDASGITPRFRCRRQKRALLCVTATQP